MTGILILAIVLITVAAALATFRDVHDDGLGHRPPPPSHYPDPFDPAQHLRAS